MSALDRMDQFIAFARQRDRIDLNQVVNHVAVGLNQRVVDRQSYLRTELEGQLQEMIALMNQSHEVLESSRMLDGINRDLVEKEAELAELIRGKEVLSGQINNEMKPKLGAKMRIHGELRAALELYRKARPRARSFLEEGVDYLSAKVDEHLTPAGLRALDARARNPHGR